MNAQAINAIGYLMSQIRPEWDTPGCVAALRRLDDMPVWQLTIAAARYAADEQNLTPGNLPNLANRAWDSEGYPPCPVHPEYRARRIDGTCGMCWVDKHAATEPLPLRRKGHPIPPAVREQLLAEIKPRPKAEAPTLDTDRLTAARAEVEAARKQAEEVGAASE